MDSATISSGHFAGLRDGLFSLFRQHVYWDVRVICQDGKLDMNRLLLGLPFPQLTDETVALLPEFSVCDVEKLVRCSIRSITEPRISRRSCEVSSNISSSQQDDDVQYIPPDVPYSKTDYRYVPYQYLQTDDVRNLQTDSVPHLQTDVQNSLDEVEDNLEESDLKLLRVVDTANSYSDPNMSQQLLLQDFREQERSDLSLTSSPSGRAAVDDSSTAPLLKSSRQQLPNRLPDPQKKKVQTDLHRRVSVMTVDKNICQVIHDPLQRLNDRSRIGCGAAKAPSALFGMDLAAGRTPADQSRLAIRYGVTVACSVVLPRLRIVQSKPVSPKLKEMSLKNGDQHLAGENRRKKQRWMRRCRMCEACTVPNCQVCGPCRDMKKYGGPSLWKKSCLRRPKCLFPRTGETSNCKSSCGSERT